MNFPMKVNSRGGDAQIYQRDSEYAARLFYLLWTKLMYAFAVPSTTTKTTTTTVPDYLRAFIN